MRTGRRSIRCSTELTTFLVKGFVMSGRRWLWCVALALAGVSLACGDVTSPTSSTQKRAPAGASFSRYILISGVETCVEDCDEEGGPEVKVEGLPTSPLDSLPILVPPIDTVPDEGN